MSKLKIAALAVALAAFACLFIWIGSIAGRPAVEKIEPLPAHLLPSGAVVLEEKPVAKVEPIKRGTRVTRQVSVTVKPKQAGCDPVTATVQLAQDGDHVRAVTSAEGGEVVGGVDSPVMPSLIVHEPKRWAAGLSCNVAHCQQTPGVWIERDAERVRLGVEASRRLDGKPELRARIGWSF